MKIGSVYTEPESGFEFVTGIMEEVDTDQECAEIAACAYVDHCIKIGEGDLWECYDTHVNVLIASKESGKRYNVKVGFECSDPTTYVKSSSEDEV